MSENEFDVQRDRAEEDRENVVLTGEEIELPGRRFRRVGDHRRVQ